MASPGTSIALVIVLPESEGGALEGLMPRLRGLRPGPREILAVGGGQPSGSPERKLGNRRLRILPVEPNWEAQRREGGLPQAVAWNRGCSEVTAALVVFLAHDAVPAGPDWLERLTAPLEDPQVAAAYGRQEPLQEEPLSALRLSERFGLQGERHRARLGDPPAGGAPAFSLANAVIRRSVWQAIHFNEHYPIGADREWARQVLLSSYTIAYVPEALVRRAEHESIRDLARNALLQGWNDARLGSAPADPQAELASFARRAAWHLLKTGKGSLLPRLYADTLAQAFAYRLGRRLHRIAPSLRSRIAPEIAGEEPRRELSEWERAA